MHDHRRLAGGRPKVPNQGAGKVRGLLERFSSELDLPPDLLLDLPRATLVGGVQLLIENHRGLLEYTPGRVRILTGAGQLTVVGERLTIGRILRDELRLDGRIDAVYLTEAGEMG